MDKYCMIPLANQTHKRIKYSSGNQGLGGKGNELLFNGYIVSVMVDE